MVVDTTLVFAKNSERVRRESKQLLTCKTVGDKPEAHEWTMRNEKFIERFCLYMFVWMPCALRDRKGHAPAVSNTALDYENRRL